MQWSSRGLQRYIQYDSKWTCMCFLLLFLSLIDDYLYLSKKLDILHQIRKRNYRKDERPQVHKAHFATSSSQIKKLTLKIPFLHPYDWQ